MTVLAVIIGLSALILGHEAGHFFVAKWFRIRVDEFGFGFPPRLWGKRIGETTYSVNLLPFGGFVRIHGEDGADGVEDAHSFTSQPVWKRSAVVLSGVAVNFLLGGLLLAVVFTAGTPRHLMVADVASGSPAAAGGIESGDVITRATATGITLTDPVPTDEFIAIAKRSIDEPIRLVLQRGQKTVEVALVGRANPPPGQGSLGIELIGIGTASVPFPKSLADGFAAAGSDTGEIAAGFVALFGKLFVSPQVIETVSGPVGIVTLASQASALGFIYLLQLMAIISLNLTVLNLIPFPALDGGRFLFLLFEKVKGTPIPLQFQRVVNAIGFVALVALMVAVTVQDVGRLIK